jgi:hypothetical protein
MTERSGPGNQSTKRINSDLIPACKASQPQLCPMTSTTNARECESAVVVILSTTSQIRCKAVEAPMVRSVMGILFSTDPANPTILRCP